MEIGSLDNLAFQKAEDTHVEMMLGIYNFYLINTTATFDHIPVSRDEFTRRIFICHEKYSTYLIRYSEEIAGFCFITQFRIKPPYNRTAEIGVYLKPESIGRGIGGEAILFLEKVAIGKQIRVLIASVSGENTSSLKLVQKMGYQECAHYREVGEKFGRLLDVVDFQKILKT
jgi:L-amino acid N-acyltransferase YncA